MDILAPKLIGNESVRRYLQTLVNRGNVQGSYLFVGPAGVGKMTAALTLAHALQCRGLGQRAPCGACLSCREWAKGLRPDTLVVEQPADRTAIVLEQIRPSPQSDVPAEATIHHRLRLKPLVGRRQIIIINGAGALNIAAANALLKTLEEPQRDTTLILIAEHPDDLPSTVVSRCAVVYFTRVPTDAIHDHLKRVTTLAPERASYCARLAHGSPGRALALATDPDLLEQHRDDVEVTLAKLQLLTEEPFGLSEGVTPVDRGRARTRVRDTLRLLEVILEDLLYLSSGTPEFLTLKTHQQSLLRLSQHFGQDRLVRFGERLRRARRQIDHNVSPKTALDGLTNALAYAP